MKRKYNNKPVVLDGIRFDSQREARRWGELRLLERAGEISALERQRTFVLAPSVKFEGAKRAQPALRYTCDFYYGEKGQRIVEDVKSSATAKTTAFIIRRHLMLSLYGLQIRIV